MLKHARRYEPGALDIPEWALPALAQGETLVPFTDAPPAFPAPGPVNRQYDIRTIDGPFSPADRFFTTQHYGHPVVEPAAFRLKLTGLLNRPLSLSLDELRKVGSTELIAGFECSGNRRPAARVVRATADGPACRCAPCSIAPAASSLRRARSSSSAPIAARKRWSSERRSSPLNSSTAAA